MNDIAKALGELMARIQQWDECAPGIKYMDVADAAYHFVCANHDTLAALVADGGWLPIETAPIRGRFLVFGGEWVAESDSPDRPRQPAEITLVNRCGRPKFYVADAEEMWPCIEYPTHWRPLPPPPDAARAGGGCE